MPDIIYEQIKMVEPIRESLIVLTTKILLTMITIDFLYILLRVLFFDLNPHSKFIPEQYVTGSFFLFLIFSYVLEICLVIFFIQKWVRTLYIIEKNTLVVRSGILKTTERVYDLKNLRSVSVSQGLLGKLFRFGSVEISITSPNLLEKPILDSIPNPREVEERLKKILL